MTRLRASLAILCLAASSAGCATVAMVEPTPAADVGLSDARSDFYAAADAFSEASRRKGLATGEASLAGLAGAIFGRPDEANSYWRRIGADREPQAAIVKRVRADAADLASGLGRLEGMAKALAGDSAVESEDVAAFEGALIHARQGREALAQALMETNRRLSGDIDAGTELAALDQALASARKTADDMAAAKTAASLAAGRPPRAAG